jgi:hypothetical protein
VATTATSLRGRRRRRKRRAFAIRTRALLAFGWRALLAVGRRAVESLTFGRRAAVFSLGPRRAHDRGNHN